MGWFARLLGREAKSVTNSLDLWREIYGGRDAKTGEFIPVREAVRRPATTVVETIKYPTDEQEPYCDVFDVVAELVNSKFEIPFDMEASFAGNPADLTEHDAEMWMKIR